MTGPHPQLVNGLYWVRTELEASLGRARTALEQHLETPEDAAPLQTVAEELQIVRGTLGMIQCFGAAMLAGEMNLLLQALRDGSASAHDEAFSALSGATLQLSDYLDLLAHGEPDRVVILQTALNELRVARSQPLFTEAELFAAQAQAEGLALTLPDDDDSPGAAAEASQARAKQDLVTFQNAFLQWFRGVGSADALARMGRIADGIAGTLRDPRLRSLWLAYAALAESLGGSASVDSLDLKRLFGRAGSQLKLLADAGEAAAAAQIGDLAYLLLFHIARAPHPASRGVALLDRLGVAAVLPAAAKLDELRRRLRGPGSSILQRVYAEIRNDFAGIKDGIDLAVRTNGRAPLDRAETPARIRRLATTLSALGLPAPQQALVNQIRVLEAGTPDALTWIEVATAILRVEHSLEEALFRTIGRQGDDATRSYAEIETEVPHAQDLRDSTKALLRESLIDFSQLKSGVDLFLKESDAAALAEAPRLLHEVAAGLGILGHERAAALVTELERYVAGRALERAQAAHDGHERFADAIACVEVFLEALRDNLPNPAKIVDSLAAYVGRLDFTAVPPLAPPQIRSETEAEAEPVSALPAFAEAAVAGFTEVSPFVDGEAVVAVDHIVEEPPAPVAAPVSPGIDPEMRDIFIEEAGHVLEELRRGLPLFRRDPANREALTSVRRAFHTLKGSGRMVGALRIGEFGWAVENMLNRCLEGALPLRTPVFEVVGEAIEKLPGLIANFRGVDGEDPGVTDVITRATQLAEGEPAAPEPDMRAVFCDDARERLAYVQNWIEGQDLRDEEFDIDPEVIRAFHTLKGSAAVVNAVAVSRSSADIESYLNGLRLHGRQLPMAALEFLADATLTLRAWIDALAADQFVEDDAADRLQARIDALEAPAGAAREHEVAVPARPVVDSAFAMAALDSLQALETQIQAWSAQSGPSSSGAARLQQGFILLGEGAERARCAPLAVLAQAIATRLEAWVTASGRPGFGFFATLLEIIEGLYQLLDLYREGGLNTADGTTGDAAEWLARVETLSQPSAVKPAEVVEPPVAQAFVDDVATAATAPAEPEVAEVVTDEVITLASSPAMDEFEPAVAEIAAAGDDEDVVPSDTMGFVLSEVIVPDLAPHEDIAPPEIEQPGIDLSETEPTEVELLEPINLGATFIETPAAATADLDPELLGVFIGEAEEVLESLQHYLGAWSRDTSHREALTELRRGLHTLKGSARTAGVQAMSAVAHRLETQLEGPVGDERAATVETLFGIGLDGLQRQLDALRGGSLLPAEPILDAIELVAGPVPLASMEVVPMPLPEPEPEPEIVRLPEPEAEPETPAVVEPEFEPVVVEVADDTPAHPLPIEPAVAAVAAEDFDAELGDIFSAEAAELLEALDAGFEAWQNGVLGSTVPEIQRALHTLKGGARMAGIDAMGDTTHELESKVNAVVASGEFPDAATFAQLRAQLETLQRMHDQLRRGEAQLLTAAPPPADDLVPLASQAPAAAGTVWSPDLFWTPEEETGGFNAARRETARVSVDVLDTLLNEAGEISIYRSRLDEHNAGLRIQLAEMVQTIARVREQMRMMDIETEAQIAARGLAGTAAAGPDRENDRYGQDFDPLEMDRYSRMQELSRALAESINDLTSLQVSMDEAVSGAETLLQQQSRINTEVQQGLMGTLMVPFSRQVQRLLRVVRQTAQENGRQADLQFVGAEAELDRNVLERMTAPLEHLLRNAVVHGIEPPAVRVAAGKPPLGVVQIQLKREGSQLLVEVSDDGAGLDFAAIRAKAVERGMIAADAQLSDDALARFIFEAGFSTARRLTQDAGRGIGMDVVASEVKQLGGQLALRSEFGLGTRFLIRLPLTLAVSQALLVGLGQETYAVPLPSIEGIGRIPRADLAVHYRDGGPPYAYGGRDYRVHYLGDYLGLPRPPDGSARTLTVILVRVGEGLTAQAERRIALVVDQLIGNREIVSKAAGPQISSVPGVAGATILADGRVVLILDVPALIIETARRALLVDHAPRPADSAQASAIARETVMVVDDSITMRRVAERLLVRHGYRVITAKDGLDAIALLQTEQPAVVLLDIEMPRADGFEVAAFIRNNARLHAVPIIMITSRSGEKHRERARSLGVDRYLIKPYQEEQLLLEVASVRGRLH